MVRRLLPGIFLTLIGVIGMTMAAHAKEGRWKLDMGVCYWEEGDEGPDQCDPTIGRWKLDGAGNCYFANDVGENQCSPPGTSESEVAPSEGPEGGGSEHATGAEQNRDVPAKR